MRFADGTPLDAEAVKFTFERIKAIGAGPSELFPSLDRVEVVGPLAVRFILSKPFGPFLSTLAHPAASIVNPKVVRAHATADDPWARNYLATNTAGSGPFGSLQRAGLTLRVGRQPTWRGGTRPPKKDKNAQEGRPWRRPCDRLVGKSSC